MEFEWDESKNKANLRKHGISFEEAKIVFDNPRLSWQDRRRYYGEKRIISLGLLEDEVVATVVYVNRNNKVRLISIRKANRKERRRYYAYLKKKT